MSKYIGNGINSRLKAKLEIITSKLGFRKLRHFMDFCTRDYCLRNKHIIPKDEEVDKYIASKGKEIEQQLPTKLLMNID